ncbi:NAD(P)/FAD-dependent oxidoreductase [Niabella insulamsoli]|uniref:NAD(P)/FAD-dependent oxidoreductase n=1 Tax=Niabella insulamsoli TaxID=3144874 RepID=UPI0031FC3420
MRLRTYESFWLLKNGLLYSYPSAQQNLTTDTVVLGGGITGALISDALISEGYKVLLLDKNDIASGSTAATTSMLQYEIDVPLYQLSNKIGEEAAATCYQCGIDAILELEALVKQRKIDCGFQKKDSLFFAHTAAASKSLYKEFEARKKHRLGVKWLSAAAIKKLYGIKSHGGILSETAASVDAYKLAHELIRSNTQKGLQVYDQVDIKKIHHNDKGILIELVNGCSIKSKKIIYCTGYETVRMFRKPVADLHSTFACVSEQGILINEKLNRLLVWNTRNPYLYLRTTDDGRLLVGGADSKYTSATYLQKNKEQKSKDLMKQLQEAMPGIHFINDINWAGIFGSTKDGLPYIGPHPDFKNSFFVLGFGGNGITFSVQGRKIITDLLQDQPNELASFYRFDR